MRVYTEQNKGVNEFYKEFGYSRETKAARKLQEYLTKQTEKYLKEMENSISEY